MKKQLSENKFFFCKRIILVFFSVFVVALLLFLCHARPKRKTLFSIRHSFFGPVIVFFHHFLLYTFMLEMLLLLFPFIIFFVAFIHCQLFSSALWTFFQYRFAWMFCFLALSHFISRLSILCCCCYFFVCKLTLFAVYVLCLLFFTKLHNLYAFYFNSTSFRTV